MNVLRFILTLQFSFIFILSFGQDLNQSFSSKSINIHTLDFFRYSSPALKISYELESEKTIKAFEASMIYDFNAEIFRINDSERGIIGSSLAFFYMKKLSSNSNNNFGSYGFRLNFAYKERSIEKWVSRKLFSYRQRMHYKQTNQNLGMYFRLARNVTLSNNIRIGFALNTGYLFLEVNNDLPPDAQQFSNSFFLTTDSYLNNQKSEGLHYYPHIYGEFSLGYEF